MKHTTSFTIITIAVLVFTAFSMVTLSPWWFLLGILLLAGIGYQTTMTYYYRIKSWLLRKQTGYSVDITFSFGVNAMSKSEAVEQAKKIEYVVLKKLESYTNNYPVVWKTNVR